MQARRRESYGGSVAPSRIWSCHWVSVALMCSFADRGRSRALSATEINAIYAAGSAGKSHDDRNNVSPSQMES